MTQRRARFRTIARRAGPLALLGFFLVGASHAGAADYDSGWIQAEINPGHSIAEVNARYHTSTIDSLPPLYLLQVPPGQDDDALLQEMAWDSAGTVLCVEHAWKNETPEGLRQMVVAAVGGTITGFLDQGLATRLHLAEIHSRTTGEGVKIAVIDTGVKADHEALAGAILPGGYDFVDNDSDPDDSANGVDDDLDSLVDEAAGHGTMVAGIIHLVAPGATILPIRVLDDEGHGTTFAVAKGIRYAVEHGANIINMSLGLTTHSEMIAHEVAAAREASVAMVAAAGNLGADSVQFYPASDSKVMMVAALDSADVKAPFSSYHAKVAVSAPGVGIFAPFHDGAYAIGAGTSFATPFVTGACALLMALEPGLSWDELYQRVADSVEDIYEIPENDPYRGELGTGRVDGLNMLLTSPIAADLRPAVSRDPGIRVYPNPSPSGGRIILDLSAVSSPRRARVRLSDVNGRQVRILETGGARKFAFDARDENGRGLPSGIYFLQGPGLPAGGRVQLTVVR